MYLFKLFIGVNRAAKSNAYRRAVSSRPIFSKNTADMVRPAAEEETDESRPPHSRPGGSVGKIVGRRSECAGTLHAIAVCRSALDSLMAEVIEGHIRFHVLDPERAATESQTQAADDLIDALKTYLK